MRDWQFNTLFVLAVLGCLVMLFGDSIGLQVRPEAITIFGTLLAFILTQRNNDRDRPEKRDQPKPASQDGERDG